MITKNSLFTIFIMTILVLGVVACGQTNTMAPTPTATTDIAQAKPVASGKDSVSINGVTIELTGGWQLGDQFQVEVCYNLPDSRDWLLSIDETDNLLSIDGKEYHANEENMASRDKGSDGKYIYRCDALLFPVQNVAPGTPFQISISKIYVSENEVLDCPAIQKKIDAVQPGILIQCVNKPHMSGFNVISWPKEMTEMTALELAHDINNDAQVGPWVLSGVSEKNK